MDVQDEPRLSKRWRIQPHERRHSDRLERRVHAHSVAVTHLVREVHRLAVHHDHGDLGVRHSERLCQVLDRGPGGHRDRDGSTTSARWQEVVQTSDEADFDAVGHPGRAYGHRIPVESQLVVSEYALTTSTRNSVKSFGRRGYRRSDATAAASCGPPSISASASYSPWSSCSSEANNPMRSSSSHCATRWKYFAARWGI